MAVTIKFQRFESASYDWYGETTADVLPQIQSELDSWISSVNGNTSNTGRQITREKGYADRTTNTDSSPYYKGMVISCGANNNTEKGYMQFIAFSGAKRMSVGGGWTDDGSSNGYGLIDTSGGGYLDTSISWPSSTNVDVDYLIMTDTVDGEEFFILGINYLSSQSYEGWAIWKAENGEWCMEFNDSSNGGVLHYWTDATGVTGWNNGNRSSSNESNNFFSATSGQYRRRGFSCNTFTNWDPVTYPDGGVIIAANKQLIDGGGQYGGRVFAWTDFSATREVYNIFPYPYGPAVYVDARP